MLEVKNIKLVNKGALVCSFTIFIDNLGLSIHECKYFKKDNKKWISMPQREYEKEGKKYFFSYVWWEKERQKALEQKIIPLIKESLENLHQNG